MSSMLFSPPPSFMRAESIGAGAVSGGLTSSPSAFFLSSPPPPSTLNMDMNVNATLSHDMQASLLLVSPEPIIDASAQSMVPLLEQVHEPHHPVTQLRFSAASSVQAPAGFVGAFNFAPQPQVQAGHHDPSMLEGFMLDGGCAPINDIAHEAQQPSSSTHRRKRKSTSSAASSGDDEVAQANGGGREKKRRGKSLVDVSRSMSSSSLSSTGEGSISGHVSPLLDLLQNGSQASFSEGVSQQAPEGTACSKRSSKRERRQRAALKVRQLEESIAMLQAQVSSTLAQEAHATMVAQHMAQQAQQAALLASQHMAQQQCEAGMVDSFFARDEQEDAHASSSSLPPLSPPLASSSLRVSLSCPSSASSQADSSSSSVSDSGLTRTLSHCSTPIETVAGASSPVRSLDDAIDEVMAQQAEGSEARSLLESRVRELHWAEQARSLRLADASLYALESHVDAVDMCAPVACVPLALRFIDARMHEGESSAFAARASLAQLLADEQPADSASDEEMRASLRDLSQALLAKSRAQQATCSLTA